MVPWSAPACDLLLDRQGGAEAGRAEEVVAAAVAGGAFVERLLFAGGLLGQPGQGVVFAHHRDHRAAFAVGGDEGGRHAGKAALDL